MQEETAELNNRPGKKARIGGTMLFLLGFVAVAKSNLNELSVAYAQGQSVGQAAILFAILYFSWLRGAAIWKSIATFAVLLVVTFFITMPKLSHGYNEASADIETFAHLELDDDGRLITPDNAGNGGQLTKIIVKYSGLRDELLIRFDDRMARAGLFDMLDAEALSRKPAILGNCGSITAIKPDIQRYRKEHLALMDSMRAEIEAAPILDEFKRGYLAGMDKSFAKNRADTNHFWDINAGQVDDAYAICVVLAHHNWRARGEAFEFTSTSDMNEFSERNRRLLRADAEIQQMIQKSQQSLTNAQTKLKS